MISEYYNVPLMQLPYKAVNAYWQALIDADTLKYRLSDVTEPGWPDIQKMIERHQKSMFHIVRFKKDEVKIVSDFMLDNFMGRSAQGHFSMHPDNSIQLSTQIGRNAVNEMLNVWKHPEGGPFLQSIFGVTPKDNRVACIFIQRMGFKLLGLIPGGCPYLGGVSDAMISVATKENIDGIIRRSSERQRRNQDRSRIERHDPVHEQLSRPEQELPTVQAVRSA